MPSHWLLSGADRHIRLRAASSGDESDDDGGDSTGTWDRHMAPPMPSAEPSEADSDDGMDGSAVLHFFWCVATGRSGWYGAVNCSDDGMAVSGRGHN